MSARKRSAALAAVAVAIVASGCGSSKELPRDIPPATANSLLENLNAVTASCAIGDTQGAADAAGAYVRAVDLVPPTVDSDVRKVLEDTASKLVDLSQGGTGCDTGPSGTSGLQGAHSKTDTSTAAAVTTTPTETTATAPETQTPVQTPPADNGQGHGNGTPPADNGNGNGNSGGGHSGGNSGGVGAGKRRGGD